MSSSLDTYRADSKHPLYRIEFFAPGTSKILPAERNKYALRRSFNAHKGFAHLLQEYEAPHGMMRNTLRDDILKWFSDMHEGHISILAGYGLTYITIWSKRDAALFKVWFL